MLDRALFIDDFDNTARRLARKGVERGMVAELRDHLLRRRELQAEVDRLRADLNRRSAEIGSLHREGRGAEAESIKTEIAKTKERLAGLESSLKQAEERVEYLILRIPNLPDDSSPDGTDESSNVVLRYEGYNPDDYRVRAFAPHWEIGTRLGIYDAERATKLSGSMFALLRQDGARLLRALTQLALDLNREKYVEFLPAHFVRSEVLVGTGHLPKFEMEAYKLRDDDLWAIPTGEVPLTALHRGEILEYEELPKRYMAYTSCFRREAGSAGKDTRGMQRLHEFHKVELVRLCAEEQVQSEFEDLLADAERTLKVLGLPYRVVDLCTGDLTFASSRIFDLEVYSPGVDKWLEVSSVGIFTDFQARRGNARYRQSGGGRKKFLFALNGSGVATPRVFAAILEHGQQPDGSVRLPEALVPYMGKAVLEPE
jgi:seryl-tRNA synthetase